MSFGTDGLHVSDRLLFFVKVAGKDELETGIYVNEGRTVLKFAMREEKIKIRVQRRIVLFSVLLLVGKFIAFYVTNSVGILTDALESIVNVAAGFISLYSIIVAAKPRDVEHPYGHGKVELISASVEGILIMVAGATICFEGIRRFFYPIRITQLDVGIWIVAFAGAVNYVLGMYSIRVGRRYTSAALIAGGKHLQSDTYSSVGLVAGLLVLYWTGIVWIDSALALLFGSIILYTGIQILRATVANLIDKADLRVLKQILEELVMNRQEDWIDIRNMKMLKYGKTVFVDCNLTLPWYYDMRRGQKVCERMAELIARKFESSLRLCIHTDPCTESYCRSCILEKCRVRRHPFVSLSPFTLDRITADTENGQST